MAEVKTSQFKKIAVQTINDQQAQASLKRLAHFREGQEAAIEETGHDRWEQLREQGRAIKSHTLENLDYYLEQLASNVERAGGKVFFARDSREANNYVAKVARDHNVRSVIKAKSMVAEEMGIGDVLQRMGLSVTETDLGEYIVQLAGEAPYHIIAPAVHKSKEQVADLFAQKLNVPRGKGIPELAAVARKALREEFLQADMGMTGVNFAVAETGTIVIVTNEGNGRMCTSLPKVHIATMGMERVIPRFQDLGVFLKLLTRAATGQRITSYVSMLSGPRRAEEEDGPNEFHLVILDNGRSRMLANPDLREALLCIRCGACLNACPVYNKVGGHAYGWVYPGPIGAIVTPMLVGLPKAKDLPYASTLCGACREVCPLKINIPRMLVHLRGELMQGRPQNRTGPLWERLLIEVWALTMQYGWAFTLAGKLGALAQRPLLRDGKVRWLPPPFSAWTRTRDFPAVASKAFRSRWARIKKQNGAT